MASQPYTAAQCGTSRGRPRPHYAAHAPDPVTGATDPGNRSIVASPRRCGGPAVRYRPMPPRPHSHSTPGGNGSGGCASAAGGPMIDPAQAAAPVLLPLSTAARMLARRFNTARGRRRDVQGVGPKPLHVLRGGCRRPCVSVGRAVAAAEEVGPAGATGGGGAGRSRRWGSTHATPGPPAPPAIRVGPSRQGPGP